MTACNPSAGNDLGLFPIIRCDDLLASMTLAAADAENSGASSSNGFFEPSEDDSPSLRLYRQWLAEEHRISTCKGPVSAEEARASLALTHDLARRILKGPLHCTSDAFLKFLALSHLPPETD